MQEGFWSNTFHAESMHAAWLGVILGLVIGSFLNVVIYRLPRMIRGEKRFNLSTPGSFCPTCGHKIRWHENIPVISFVLLKGQCGQCASPIGLTYPAVELLAALAFSLSLYRHGVGFEGLVWCLLWSVSIPLAVVVSQGRHRSKDNGPHDRKQ